jgi:hypothetical protein
MPLPTRRTDVWRRDRVREMERYFLHLRHAIKDHLCTLSCLRLEDLFGNQLLLHLQYSRSRKLRVMRLELVAFLE